MYRHTAVSLELHLIELKNSVPGQDIDVIFIAAENGSGCRALLPVLQYCLRQRRNHIRIPQLQRLSAEEGIGTRPGKLCIA